MVDGVGVGDVSHPVAWTQQYEFAPQDPMFFIGIVGVVLAPQSSKGMHIPPPPDAHFTALHSVSFFMPSVGFVVVPGGSGSVGVQLSFCMQHAPSVSPQISDPISCSILPQPLALQVAVIAELLCSQLIFLQASPLFAVPSFGYAHCPSAPPHVPKIF